MVLASSPLTIKGDRALPRFIQSDSSRDKSKTIILATMSRSLIPSLLGLDRWNSWGYPARISDQDFGLALTDDDFLPPRFCRGFLIRPRRYDQKQMKSSGLSEVTNTADKFQVSMDVSHFNPEDITVKTVDGCVVIRGKHEEKSDEHWFIGREFMRSYPLPKDVQPESVVSSLSSDDGVLTVEAPKVRQLPSNERVIPITRKETPAVASEENAEK